MCVCFFVLFFLNTQFWKVEFLCSDSAAEGQMVFDISLLEPNLSVGSSMTRGALLKQQQHIHVVFSPFRVCECALNSTLTLPTFKLFSEEKLPEELRECV